MVFDKIEAAFKFDPCTIYFVTPWLTIQEVTRQQYQTLILGSIPT